MRRVIVLVLLTAWFSACGVGAQQQPNPVEVQLPTGQAPSGVEPGTAAILVYLVRDDRLQPVQRSVVAASADTALRSLVAGPTPAEAASGVRTALVPQLLTVGLGPRTGDGTVVVAATRDLVGVTGENQLLAVAQVVWTVTDLAGIDRVRLAIDGTPLELPTDAGLSSEPVGRRDYQSVAPPPTTKRRGRQPHHVERGVVR